MLVSEEKYAESRELCRTFIDNTCIWRSVNGERIPGKTPGHSYSWQFYLRKALFHKSFMNIFTDLFVYQIEREVGHFNFQIAGLETASTPMISALPIFCEIKYGINIYGYSVRKERKEYGLRNWVEGLVLDDVPTLIVDDLCNSGNSVLDCYDILTEELNYEVLPHIFTVVNKANTNDYEKMELDKYFRYCGIRGINFISPFSLDDFKLYIAPGDDLYMFK